MSRYLTWLGFKTRVFNVGQARRQMPGYEFHNHQFFSSSDENARQMREEIALGVLEVMNGCIESSPPTKLRSFFFWGSRFWNGCLMILFASDCLMQPTPLSSDGFFLLFFY